MSLRSGLRSGVRSGLRSGLNPGDSNSNAIGIGLIALWGQSNCTGRDDFTNIANANGYGDPFARVTLAQKITSGTADPLPFLGPFATGSLAPRAAAGQDNMGPELALGRRLALVVPTTTWSINKWGIDSSGMEENWLPTSTFPASTQPPNLFHLALNDLAAQAASENATVAALVWLQGETDALTAGPSADYQSNLTAFIAAVRAVYPNLPIVLGQIPSISPETFNAVVRTAQTSVAAVTSQCTLFDTSDLGPLITTYHFQASALVTLGRRCATAVLNLIGYTDALPTVAWTTDGDGIGFPANATEWAAVLAAANIASGGPFRASDCTVASGNLTDLIGSVPLVASGAAATYHATAPGFTRTGVSATDGATTSFSTADSSLPDLSTASMLTLTYVRVNTSPGTFRNLTSQGAGTRLKAALKNGGLVDVFEGGSNNTSGTKVPAGAVRPFVTQHNRAASQGVFATDLETFTITFDGTVTGIGLSIVGDVNGAPNAVTMYEASFKGAAAELTTAQIRTLLQVLGWTVQW